MRVDDDSLVTADRACAFEFDEFAYLVDIAFNAAALRAPVENPERTGVTLENERGASQRYVFTDTPANRAMLAVKKEVGSSSKRFWSFMWRFWALAELIHHRKLAPWLRDEAADHGAQSLHPAVLDVARRMKMTKRGKFDTHDFIALVRKSSAGAQAGDRPGRR